MQDREAYRRAAAECLDLASAAQDQNIRTRLTVLASKFLDLAGTSERASVDNGALNVLLDEFNTSQMRK